MLSLYARAFGIIQAVLIDAEHRLSKLDADAPVDRNEQWLLRSELNTVYPECLQLQMTPSMRRIARLLISLDPFAQDKRQVLVPAARGLVAELKALRETIDEDLRDRLFLFVPTTRANLYEQPDLFGTHVNVKFGKAAADIKDAGNCLALARTTASVFHLMCVLEVGLDSLASALGLPYRQANWGTILRDIEDKIKAIGPPLANWKEDTEFYSGAALEFRFFKDAWRNHVAHARARYNEGDASHIFEHVKAFMQHLSTRLHERP